MYNTSLVASDDEEQDPDDRGEERDGDQAHAEFALALQEVEHPEDHARRRQHDGDAEGKEGAGALAHYGAISIGSPPGIQCASTGGGLSRR